MLDHIAINVKDINESVNWYKSNFNTEVKYQDETWAMLCVNGVNLALTISKQHPPHIAFKRHEPPPEDWKAHRDGSRYKYIEDPDGNTIEMVWWPDGDQKET